MERKAKYLCSVPLGEKTREVGPDKPGGGKAATASAVRFCGLHELETVLSADDVLVAMLPETPAEADLLMGDLPK